MSRRGNKFGEISKKGKIVIVSVFVLLVALGCVVYYLSKKQTPTTTPTITTTPTTPTITTPTITTGYVGCYHYTAGEDENYISSLLVNPSLKPNAISISDYKNKWAAGEFGNATGFNVPSTPIYPEYKYIIFILRMNKEAGKDSSNYEIVFSKTLPNKGKKLDSMCIYGFSDVKAGTVYNSLTNMENRKNPIPDISFSLSIYDLSI